MDVHSRFITEFRSYSHILNETAFAPLMRDELLTRVIEVKDDRFKLEVIMTEEMKKENKDYWGYPLVISSSYLMAFNIAGLGYFTWLSGNRMFWNFDHTGPDGKVEQITMHAVNKFYPADQKTVLTENEVRNSMIICGSIVREEDQSFRKEYLKGIVHLDIGFADLSFYREAFANFYRSFELFVTARILKKTKLKNELKEIQDALLSLGLPQEMCNEFRVLYKMRSEQVMHAQRLPKEIDSEDVLKIKVFADYVLYKYYRSKAEEWREVYHANRSKLKET